jgi:hypothetical protein
MSLRKTLKSRLELSSNKQNTEPVQGTLRFDPGPTLTQNSSRNPLATGTTAPGPLKSSSVPPHNTVSQPNASVIPKNLLAFRLITKMLQLIPQTQPFVSMDNLGDDNNWKSEDCQEVRISDAFAHLAIFEYGTVAIATNRYSSHSTLEPQNLSIIACASVPESEGSKEPTPKVSILDKVWNIMFAKNARKEEPVSSFPTIITPVRTKWLHQLSESE